MEIGRSLTADKNGGSLTADKNGGIGVTLASLMQARDRPKQDFETR